MCRHVYCIPDNILCILTYDTYVFLYCLILRSWFHTQGDPPGIPLAINYCITYHYFAGLWNWWREFLRIAGWGSGSPCLWPLVTGPFSHVIDIKETFLEASAHPQTCCLPPAPPFLSHVSGGKGTATTWRRHLPSHSFLKDIEVVQIEMEWPRWEGKMGCT